MKKYILFLIAAAVSHCGLAADKPNILFIIADDLGYSDIGCYGAEIKTPAIDSLASAGLRYTSFYNAGRCWPTRSAINSGYYAVQTGSDPYFRDKKPDERVQWVVPLPKVMQSQGYKTYHSGKWHAQIYKAVRADLPATGYDRAYENTHGDKRFSFPVHFLDGNRLENDHKGEGMYAAEIVTNYMLEFLKEHKEKYSDKPFYAYLSYLEPHFPLRAPQKNIAKYKGVYDAGWDVVRKNRFDKMMKLGFPKTWKLSNPEESVISSHSPQTEEAQKAYSEAVEAKDGEVFYYKPWSTLTAEQKKFQSKKMEIHAAMIDKMDEEIGRVLKYLKDTKQYDNTLIIFMSDNGADSTMMFGPDCKHVKGSEWGTDDSYICMGPAWANVSNTPFRRHKIWVHEGGVVTPFVVKLPKDLSRSVKQGDFRHARGNIIDLMPTFVNLAGGKLENPNKDAPPYPGKSLMPTFPKDVDVERDFMYFDHVGNFGIIKGDWKLVSARQDGGEFALYNLKEDATEMNDLSKKHPEIHEELRKLYIQTRNKYRKQGLYDIPNRK